MAIDDDDFVMLLTEINNLPTALYEAPPLLGQVEDAAAGLVVWEDGRRSDYGGSIATNDGFRIVAGSVANAGLINAVLRALGDNVGQLLEGPVVRTYSIELPSDASVIDFLTIKTPLGFFSAPPVAFEVVPSA